jgi:hypothetical protein
MLLTWDSSQVGRTDRDGAHAVVRAGVLVLIAGFLVIVPLAYAGSPDPIWIPGIYDNADEDEVIALLTGGTGAGGTPPPGSRRCGMAEDRCHILRGMVRSETIRGPPPIEARWQLAAKYRFKIGVPRHGWPVLRRAPPTYTLAADPLVGCSSLPWSRT